MYFTLFLISLISHILGDFVFQSDKIVKGREGANNVKYKWYISSGKYNLIHAFIHSIIFILLTWIVIYTSTITLNNYLFYAIVIFLIHFIIDYGKSCYKIIMDKLPFRIESLVLFILDQFLHFLSLYIVFIVFNDISFEDFLQYIYSLYSQAIPYNNFLSIVFIILFCSYGVGYFSKFLLKSIGRNSSQEDEGAKNGGFIIGICERLFIIISVVCSQYGLIAVILTLKSIARFKKFSEDYFVECFIVGTLVSLVTAFIGGILIYNLI